MKVPGSALAAVLMLSACSGTLTGSGNPVHKVDVGGDAYLVTQLTAGTWTMTAATLTPTAIRQGPLDKARQISAIEKASGCKVTDSDYSRQGKQLDAQVDCGSRLKN